MNQTRLFVIPLAGEGSRFPIGKWLLPKPLIQYNGVSFLEYSIRSLPIKISDKIIFVIRDGLHRSDLEISIDLLCNAFDTTVVVVPGATKGQADSVSRGLVDQNLDSTLWIHNGDTALNCDWDKLDSGLDGTLITFTSSSPRWSFVETNPLGKVLRVEEKNPISDHASTGTYIFKKASDFLESLGNQEGCLIEGEQYVAPLYNYLIQRGKKFAALNCSEVFCLGTPEDFDLAKEGLENRWRPSW